MEATMIDFRNRMADIQSAVSRREPDAYFAGCRAFAEHFAYERYYDAEGGLAR